MPPTAKNQAFFFRGWHGGGTLRFSWQYQNPRCTLDNDFSQSWTEHWASHHHKQSSQEPFLDMSAVSATASSHSSGRLTQNNHSHRILIWHIYVYHKNQANVGKYTIHWSCGMWRCISYLKNDDFPLTCWFSAGVNVKWRWLRRNEKNLCPIYPSIPKTNCHGTSIQFHVRKIIPIGNRWNHATKTPCSSGDFRLVCFRLEFSGISSSNPSCEAQPVSRC